MPELDFQITGVRAAAKGLTPLLQFAVSIKNSSVETVRSILLHAQIQIQCPRRTYNPREKANLVELFGAPEHWGQTLRNCLWTIADTTVGGFDREIEATLTVPCSYDLKFAATKYFYGMEEDAVPLLFLFSGTIFYSGEDGHMQMKRISWNKEAVFQMPLSTWKNLMEEHFPNSAWLYLRRDIFDRLYAYKRANGDATWEQTIERLLPVTTPTKLEHLEAVA